MNLFTIIWDGLRRRKIRTVLAILGITIAAASLYSLITIRQGYEAGMRSELESMGAQIIAVTKGCPYEAVATIMMGGQAPATLPENVLADIQNIPNITSASPNLYGAYYYLDHAQPLIGITVEELALKPLWNIAGSFPENYGEIMLGSAEAAYFAENSTEFNEIGDTITLTAGGKPVSLKVVGILEATASKDDFSTFTTLETAQNILNLEGRIGTVNIQVDDISKIPQTIADIEKIPDVQAVTTAQVMGTVQNLVKTGENILLMVMIIALVIGGLGTMNTMMMSIFERTREIGLLKATGVTRKQIFTLFFVEGLAISMTGGIIGIALGVMVTFGSDTILRDLIAVLPNMPIGKFSLSAILLTLLFPTAIGAIAAVYPALRASALSPIEALRKE